MYSKVFKSIFDKLLAAIIILITSPVFILLIILFYFSQEKKVFFTQKRPGKNGKVFQLIKFKTMKDTEDSNGNLLPDHLRLTRIGSMVRSLSLDELPQLINVLKGDMSLIGPRPLLVKYLDRYTTEQARRHEVKPGITGWAQVNGRNAIGWDEKFKLDVWYVDNLSFWLDMKILCMTIQKVFLREGISNQQAVTMPEFLGTKTDKSVTSTNSIAK